MAKKKKKPKKEVKMVEGKPTVIAGWAVVILTIVSLVLAIANRL